MTRRSCPVSEPPSRRAFEPSRAGPDAYDVDVAARIPAGPDVVGVAVAPPARVTAADVAALPGLRVVAAAAAGYDHLDVTALAAAGRDRSRTPPATATSRWPTTRSR